VSLHLELGEMIETYWRWTDALKHQLVAIGAWPGGQAAAGSESAIGESCPPDSVAARETITALADALDDVAGRAHVRAERLRELDPVSQELLVDIAEGLEKQIWRVRSLEAQALERHAGPSGERREEVGHHNQRPGPGRSAPDAPAKERTSWQPPVPKPILYANDSRAADEAKALLERHGIDFEMRETRDAHVSLHWNRSIYTDIFGIADFIMFAGRLLPELRRGDRGDHAIPGTMVPLRSR
jgi:starvation-inducible DNA-binding protein